jgi:chromosome segregation ATPase
MFSIQHLLVAAVIIAVIVIVLKKLGMWDGLSTAAKVKGQAFTDGLTTDSQKIDAAIDKGNASVEELIDSVTTVDTTLQTKKDQLKAAEAAVAQTTQEYQDSLTFNKDDAKFQNQCLEAVDTAQTHLNNLEAALPQFIAQAEQAHTSLQARIDEVNKKKELKDTTVNEEELTRMMKVNNNSKDRFGKFKDSLNKADAAASHAHEAYLKEQARGQIVGGDGHDDKVEANNKARRLAALKEKLAGGGGASTPAAQ